jgi:hypothetical protein
MPDQVLTDKHTLPQITQIITENKYVSTKFLSILAKQFINTAELILKEINSEMLASTKIDEIIKEIVMEEEWHPTPNRSAE